MLTTFAVSHLPTCPHTPTEDKKKARQMQVHTETSALLRKQSAPEEKKSIFSARNITAAVLASCLLVGVVAVCSDTQVREGRRCYAYGMGCYFFHCCRAVLCSLKKMTSSVHADIKKAACFFGSFAGCRHIKRVTYFFTQTHLSSFHPSPNLHASAS